MAETRFFIYKTQTNKQTNIKRPLRRRNQLKLLVAARIPTRTYRHKHASFAPDLRLRTADDPTKNKRESSRRNRPFSLNRRDVCSAFGEGGAWVSIRLAAKLPHKQGWSSNGRTGHAAANNGAGLTGFWAVENGESGGSCPATALRM